jgi:hypothetical protein
MIMQCFYAGTGTRGITTKNTASLQKVPRKIMLIRRMRNIKEKYMKMQQIHIP